MKSESRRKPSWHWCEVCRALFLAHRADGRTCSDRCRKHKSRSQLKTAGELARRTVKCDKRGRGRSQVTGGGLATRLSVSCDRGG